MKRISKLLSLTLLTAVIYQSALACGPFSVDPLFTFTKHGEYPLKDFAKGKIGVIPTSYGRMSLFLFYRQLNNLPLSANEQTSYTEALRNRIKPSNEEASSKESPGVELWKTARAKVIPVVKKTTGEKTRNDYSSFLACLDDAYSTAAKTLEARIASFGVNDDVKEWIGGQDAVFANCDANKTIPGDVGNNAPQWLKSDRQYQQAAALFYQSQYGKSREIFQRIAEDTNSVWKNTAEFVIARTYIREAGELDSESKGAERKILYNQAVQQLKLVLHDPAAKEFYQSALRLLNFVAFRNNPIEQRAKLGEKLALGNENLNFYNDLVDYIWLLDTVEQSAQTSGFEREYAELKRMGKEGSVNYKLKRQDLPDSELGLDLTDWLFTYQTPDSFDHSKSKWEETGKLHWFVAMIAEATKTSAGLSEILAEADSIKANSPAFSTVRYHQIRLLLETNKRAEANAKLAETIADTKQFGLSTQNLFLAQKTVLAKDLDEFLKDAPRRPAAFVWSDDGNEEGADLKEAKDILPWKTRTMFDIDSVAFFNEKMPLSVLRESALNPNLPVYLKKFLVIAVWTRSYLLGNQEIADEFTPLMLKYAPEYKFPQQKTDATTLLTLLRNPALEPNVPFGLGRENSDPASIDSIRGNWWCTENNTDDEASNNYWGFPLPTVFPDFLTQEQKSNAIREHNALIGLGSAATFLARRAVEFAGGNPSNPNVPEILHLAVRSTRYGCRDAKTRKYSKAAFDLLHSRFPKNEWTKKTPHYFGADDQ